MDQIIIQEHRHVGNWLTKILEQKLAQKAKACEPHVPKKATWKFLFRTHTWHMTSPSAYWNILSQPNQSKPRRKLREPKLKITKNQGHTWSRQVCTGQCPSDSGESIHINWVLDTIRIDGEKWSFTCRCFGIYSDVTLVWFSTSKPWSDSKLPKSFTS